MAEPQADHWWGGERGRRRGRGATGGVASSAAKGHTKVSPTRPTSAAGKVPKVAVHPGKIPPKRCFSSTNRYVGQDGSTAKKSPGHAPYRTRAVRLGMAGSGRVGQGFMGAAIGCLLSVRSYRLMPTHDSENRREGNLVYGFTTWKSAKIVSGFVISRR